MNPVPMSVLLRTWWRVPVVALLAAVLAFAGSFAIAPTYASTARLLVRGQDATVLSGKGQQLQQGFMGSDLAKALGETQAALVQTDTVARAVVRDLRLDERPQPHRGVFGQAKHLVGALVKRTRAILTHGFYAEPSKSEGLVQGVGAGLSGTPVKDSYVLEVRATSDDPKLSAAIADDAADVLVRTGNERFRGDSTRYRDVLRVRLAAAVAEQATAAQAVGSYKSTHGIGDISTTLGVDAQALQSLKDRQRQANADRASAQAQLASVEQSLALTPARSSSDQVITTGRGTSTIGSSAVSTAYEGLLVARAQLRAQIAGLDAQAAAIGGQLASATSSPTPLTRDEAALAPLLLTQQADSQTVQALTKDFEEATLAAAAGDVQLARVDHAIVPVYPVSPVRYLYLGLGLVLGAVLGLVLSARRLRRVGVVPVADEERVLDLDGVVPAPRAGSEPTRQAVISGQDSP